MSFETAERITKALLYEGYMLYPYYKNSAKNRQRWTFGGVYPKFYVEKNPGSDASEMQTECLIEASGDPAAGGPQVDLRVRFLHLMADGEKAADTQEWDSWEEACEREVKLQKIKILDLINTPERHPFAFFSDSESKWIQEPVIGQVELSAKKMDGNIFKITVRIINSTDEKPQSRSEALLHSMISTHALMAVEGGRFVSLTDPPEKYRGFADLCQNKGVWPILAGAPDDDRVILCSPIILYDHPEIAPESPGDLYDGGEIDEILSLRILTLTDDEKNQMRHTSDRSRALLERTENLTEDKLRKLHGRLRDLSSPFKAGDRVRVLPHGSQKSQTSRGPNGSGNRSDIFDIALAGLTARVETVEQSLEGGTFLSVTFDDDPGRDMGEKGQPGHRFFFKPHEVERL